MAEVSTPERELSYRYNFKGQRAEKIEDGQSRYYLYNQDNLLVAEIAADGTVAKEYIYLEGEPLAMLVDGQLYYYHNSHLGTPLLLSDAQQQVVWQAEYSGFGKAEVQVAIVENQLRFPGQYFDEETGLHYNYFRDYDPETGRYLQSDPIGLAGGINTYGYVLGNPLIYTDFYGLYPGKEIIEFIPSAIGADFDFYRNYRHMREANTIGADKYFHCKANCQAASRGLGGRVESYLLSEIRELLDQYFKGDSRMECDADREANDYGRKHGTNASHGDCAKICIPFRPNGLPNHY
ncbi:RHS repeat-associated core domain-containing protein [Alkalimonas sp. NCh-2]|uniref:RHS repeat-associated core domain-containing protein n=1 Tax=Alkalimonas sp. NCh-2 TaxID=3144846 RepID=UPI0031F6E12B